MKFFALWTIVSTIFAFGECLWCYQCTEGDNTGLMEFGELPECFFNNDDRSCEAFNYCVTVIFDSHPESRTVMYDCDFNVSELPHDKIVTKCYSDFCNRENTTLSTTLLPNVTTTESTTTLTNENVTTTTLPSTVSPDTENDTKSGASPVMICTSLSFFVLVIFLSSYKV